MFCTADVIWSLDLQWFKIMISKVNNLRFLSSTLRMHAVTELYVRRRTKAVWRNCREKSRVLCAWSELKTEKKNLMELFWDRWSYMQLRLRNFIFVGMEISKIRMLQWMCAVTGTDHILYIRGRKSTSIVQVAWLRLLENALRHHKLEESWRKSMCRATQNSVGQSSGRQNQWRKSWGWKEIIVDAAQDNIKWKRPIRKNNSFELENL